MADGLLTSSGASAFAPARAHGAFPAFRAESTRRDDPSFRADTDQSGEWYVWTRLGTRRPGTVGASTTSGIGWATMQRCESRELAQRLADDLNQRSLRVAV